MDAAEVTAETTLAEFVDAAGDADEKWAAECEVGAEELLSKIVGKATVPPLTKHLAFLVIGMNLYGVRDSSAGVMDMEGDFQPASRVTRDPAARARVMLRPFLGPGLA